MPQVRYRVPYEVSVNAVDLGSGKPSRNLYYFRTAFSTGVFAYGDPLPGSDVATALAAIATNYGATIIPVLNHNYSLLSLVMRSILGKQYRTPFFPLAAVVPGAPISCSTMIPHGFVTGQFVYVRGVTSPPGANGVRKIVVTSPTSFDLVGSNDALPWSNDGEVQLASGPFTFAYGDTTSSPQAVVGGVAGDAMPMFSTGSVRRLNVGVGKSFRSRVSLSPFSESDNTDGRFVPARVTAINAAFAAFNIAYSNGAADLTAKYMSNVVVSKKIAQTLPLTFPSDQPWTSGGVTFSLQPNFGSLLRRKPKLTAPIT